MTSELRLISHSLLVLERHLDSAHLGSCMCQLLSYISCRWASLRHGALLCKVAILTAVIALPATFASRGVHRSAHALHHLGWPWHEEPRCCWHLFFFGGRSLTCQLSLPIAAISTDRYRKPPGLGHTQHKSPWGKLLRHGKRCKCDMVTTSRALPPEGAGPEAPREGHSHEEWHTHEAGCTCRHQDEVGCLFPLSVG